MDRCRHCGGIWFDDKEIGVFRKLLRERDLSELVPAERSPVHLGKGISACPRCHVVMQEFTYGVNSKVTPQHCLKCQGIWLNPAQLKLFLEFARLASECRRQAYD